MIIFALAVYFDWYIRQLHVSNAFLHGVLQEDIYMEQPHEFVHPDFSTYVCKLNKSLYGLKWALRTFFKASLLEFSFVSSLVDSSLSIYHKDDIHLFFLIYVDDILVSGAHKSLIFSLITTIQSEFKMKNLGSLNYFLNIQAYIDFFGLHLRQSKYNVDLLHSTKMVGVKFYPSPCSTGIKLLAHER